MASYARSSLAALCVASLVLGCTTSSVRRFPLRDPTWKDDDETPFSPMPAEYFSPLVWDLVDHTLTRPLARTFAFDDAGEAVNVNALDEVPDSSWFTNRSGRFPFSPDDAALGPCKDVKPLADASYPWTITGAKPNGANPGFLMKTADGEKYLVKLDDTIQPERASSGDAVGSRLYFAAGFFAPCNRVVFFRRDVLRIGEGAMAETRPGKKAPMTEKDLDKIFASAFTTKDGAVRASASHLLEGKPLGPWTYAGTKPDDPNDVVPHEDRREIRGTYVFAGWLNHHDSREQNSLATWIEVKERGGWVRHNTLDWGDCLGGLWDWDMLSRRNGHAYYFDVGQIAADFVSLGTIPRMWDRVHFGPSGMVWGYFDDWSFSPDDWHDGYPNPAFSRATEHDKAWAARIVARIGDEHVDRLVDQARIQNVIADRELRRILKGRRRKILARYLLRLSPLGEPRVEGGALCMRDLATESATVPVETRSYAARAYVGDALREAPIGAVTKAGFDACVSLPEIAGASETTPEYVIVDLVAASPSQRTRLPARVHLYALGPRSFRVVGLERPGDPSPPRP